MQPKFLRVRHTLFHIALRVDHNRSPARLVPQQIRRMRQAPQIMLLQNHETPPSHYLGLVSPGFTAAGMYRSNIADEISGLLGHTPPDAPEWRS
jgi:hypothetical protein